MSTYPFEKNEKKWQKYWEENKTFKVTVDYSVSKHRRFYVLDMFPYPSSAGLHVGHPEGYTATDIYSRYLRMNGYNVLHPMGFDSFGLPAENYAIKTGTHPGITTQENIGRIEFEGLNFNLGNIDQIIDIFKKDIFLRMKTDIDYYNQVFQEIKKQIRISAIKAINPCCI